MKCRSSELEGSIINISQHWIPARSRTALQYKSVYNQILVTHPTGPLIAWVESRA